MYDKLKSDYDQILELYESKPLRPQDEELIKNLKNELKKTKSQI